MKKLFTLLLTLISTTGYVFAQTSGGPDAYGYTWKNSANATGPAYNWVNIVGKANTTIVTGLGDDNSVGPFALGFSMKYYWVDVTSIRIGSNGWMAFNSSLSNIAHGFPNIPEVGKGANFVAPFLADLTLEAEAGFTNPGKVYFYTNNVDSAVVSFINVPFWQSTSPEFIGSNTFQLILTKADNGITFQYGAMNPAIPNLTTLNDAVVGIENITESIGIEVMKDLMPPNNTAYTFYRPLNSTFQVKDLKANWSNNNKNGAFTALTGQPMPITTNVANVGNQAITAPFTVRTFVKKNGSNVFNQVMTLPRLRVATDTTVTYANQFTPATEGTYVVNPLITASGDANSGNNQNITELVAVDTTGKKREVSLLYHDGTADGSTSFGVANYYTFPFYPTQVHSIDLQLFGATGAVTANNGFNVRIYAPSPTGGLGAILFDTLLAPSDIILNVQNTIEIPQLQYATIASGGVYVAVIPNVPVGVVANTFLGTDETPPFSFRTFEIQNGQLADYRTAGTEDFMIGINIATRIGGTAVGDDMGSKAAFSNIYPNPATKHATIEFSMKETAPVQITLTNIIGSTVKTMNLGKMNAQSQKVEMNVADLKAGVYFCTLQVGENSVTKRLVVNK